MAVPRDINISQNENIFVFSVDDLDVVVQKFGFKRTRSPCGI